MKQHAKLSSPPPFQFCRRLHFSDFNNCTAKNQQYTKANQKHLSGKLHCRECCDNRLSLAYKTGSRCLRQKNDQGSPLFKLWPCNVIKRRFVQMAVFQGLKDKISSPRKGNALPIQPCCIQSCKELRSCWEP